MLLNVCYMQEPWSFIYSTWEIKAYMRHLVHIWKWWRPCWATLGLNSFSTNLKVLLNSQKKRVKKTQSQGRRKNTEASVVANHLPEIDNRKDLLWNQGGWLFYNHRGSDFSNDSLMHVRDKIRPNLSAWQGARLPATDLCSYKHKEIMWTVHQW